MLDSTSACELHVRQWGSAIVRRRSAIPSADAAQRSALPVRRRGRLCRDSTSACDPPW